MEIETFQHIVVTVRPKLIRLCRRFFDTQELAYDAEDAVQETLLRLWQMKDELDECRNPESMAVMIAKNVCIDILRLSREQYVSLDAVSRVIEDAQTDHLAIAHDTEQLIERAMAKLPATQHRMLVMRSEGMTMSEISAVCGTTVTSTKTMICAARKRMMELLKIRRDKK